MSKHWRVYGVSLNTCAKTTKLCSWKSKSKKCSAVKNSKLKTKCPLKILSRLINDFFDFWSLFVEI